MTPLEFWEIITKKYWIYPDLFALFKGPYKHFHKD